MSTPYDFIPGRLVIQDLIVGRGPRAENGADIVVHYVGKILGGKQFDSSRNRMAGRHARLRRRAARGRRLGSLPGMRSAAFRPLCV